MGKRKWETLEILVFPIPFALPLQAAFSAFSVGRWALGVWALAFGTWELSCVRPDGG
jgi:hypothetical protein